MTLHEALSLCRDRGLRLRPMLWRHEQPSRWVVYLALSGRYAEVVEREGVPRPLRLDRHGDLLGEWEVAERV